MKRAIPLVVLARWWAKSKFMVQQDGTEDISNSDEFNDLRDSFLVWQNLEMEDAAGCDLGAGTDLNFTSAESAEFSGECHDEYRPGWL